MPEAFVSDKQAAKNFFGQYGVIKRFILRPKRNECSIEYETAEGAKQALNYQGNIKIFPTPSKLDILTAKAKAQGKQNKKRPLPDLEALIRNPQTMSKPRMQPAPPRIGKTEPLTVSTVQQIDPRLVSVARNDLEALARKPARTFEEK